MTRWFKSVRALHCETVQDATLPHLVIGRGRTDEHDEIWCRVRLLKALLEPLDRGPDLPPDRLNHDNFDVAWILIQRLVCHDRDLGKAVLVRSHQIQDTVKSFLVIEPHDQCDLERWKSLLGKEEPLGCWCRENAVAL